MVRWYQGLNYFIALPRRYLNNGRLCSQATRLFSQTQSVYYIKFPQELIHCHGPPRLSFEHNFWQNCRRINLPKFNGMINLIKVTAILVSPDTNIVRREVFLTVFLHNISYYRVFHRYDTARVMIHRPLKGISR